MCDKVSYTRRIFGCGRGGRISTDKEINGHDRASGRRKSGTANHNLTLDGLRRSPSSSSTFAAPRAAAASRPRLLAVDFFFVLSGFVIAKAYTERLADDRLTS